MNPAMEPQTRQYAWYLGEDGRVSGTVEAVFMIDAAKAVGDLLMAEGQLTSQVDLYVRPDQGGRWKRFTARPLVEVLARA